MGIRLVRIYFFIGVMLESVMLHRIVLDVKKQIYKRDIIMLLIFFPSTIFVFVVWRISSFIINFIVSMCKIVYRLVKKMLGFGNSVVLKIQNGVWVKQNKENDE